MNEFGRTLYANRLVIYVTIAVAIALSLWLNGILPKIYEARASFYVPVVQESFSLVTEVGGLPGRCLRPLCFETSFADSLVF